LKRFKIPSLYGDVDDEVLLKDLPWEDVKMAISTIPDLETNMLLVETVKQSNPKTIIIMRAHTIEAALQLYQQGADYVLTPHFLGGDYLANMIGKFRINEDNYKEEKQKHIKDLNQRLKRGQRHPEIEKD
jgi:voltage-gated potassium channel Kch